jgi:ferredoxin/flavodoxin---NADP+ reductase
MQIGDKFTSETITWIAPWTPKLFSFRITRPAGYRFVAGQWARLGVLKAGQTQPVWRAYSIASATHDAYLEFYSIVVPDGEFTSELSHLKPGDTVLIEKLPYGFLTTSRFVGGKDLWLLSTGTGLAPFISIAFELEVWQQYDHIIIVHGVRQANELAYADTIAAFKTHEAFSEFFEHQPNKLIYQPCVTRESVAGALKGRIPALIESGALEAGVGVPFDLERSRVMLCGNPDMVTDTRNVLKVRGMTVSRNAKPGQIAVENYW